MSAGGVAPPRRKVPLNPLLGLLPHHARLGPVEDGLHIVPIRVEDVGGVVVGMVALVDARRTVVAPAGGESGGVEPINRCSISSGEGEVEWVRRLPFDQRQIFGPAGPKTTAGPHDPGGPGTSMVRAPRGSNAVR